MNLNIFTVLVYNAKLLTRTVHAVYIFNFTFCESYVYISLGGLCAFNCLVHGLYSSGSQILRQRDSERFWLSLGLVFKSQDQGCLILYQEYMVLVSAVLS